MVAHDAIEDHVQQHTSQHLAVRAVPDRRAVLELRAAGQDVQRPASVEVCEQPAGDFGGVDKRKRGRGRTVHDACVRDERDFVELGLLQA